MDSYDTTLAGARNIPYQTCPLVPENNRVIRRRGFGLPGTFNQLSIVHGRKCRILLYSCFGRYVVILLVVYLGPKRLHIRGDLASYSTTMAEGHCLPYEYCVTTSDRKPKAKPIRPSQPLSITSLCLAHCFDHCVFIVSTKLVNSTDVTHSAGRRIK